MLFSQFNFTADFQFFCLLLFIIYQYNNNDNYNDDDDNDNDNDNSNICYICLTCWLLCGRPGRPVTWSLISVDTVTSQPASTNHWQEDIELTTGHNSEHFSFTNYFIIALAAIKQSRDIHI